MFVGDSERLPATGTANFQRHAGIPYEDWQPKRQEGTDYESVLLEHRAVYSRAEANSAGVALYSPARLEYRIGSAQ
jgi:hypothetical protein